MEHARCVNAFEEYMGRFFGLRHDRLRMAAAEFMDMVDRLERANQCKESEKFEGDIRR